MKKTARNFLAALLAVSIGTFAGARAVQAQGSIVDSVNVVMPSELTVTQPTTTGNVTVTVTKTSQTANQVFAAPSGSAGAPVFRAIVPLDLPQHNVGTGTAPTIAAGAGAGTSPTVAMSANSTDSAGQISVLTGSAPGTSGIIGTVTFNAAYSSAPFVVFSPGNAATAALVSAAQPSVSSATGTFALTSGATALAGATQYLWNYRASQ